MLKKLYAFAAAALLAASAHAIPLVIGTDFTAVPTNTLMHDGVTANGENGNGGYLTIYGTGLGSLANYCPTCTNHVYMRDASNNTHEVAAYMELTTTPYANAGQVSGTYPVVKGLRVQVGNLDGAAYGTPLNIDVVVNNIHATNNRTTGSAPKLYYGFLVAGNAPNKRTGYVGDYEALTFTPIQGDVIYVSTTGTDGQLGDINHPLLHLQNASASNTGALWNASCSTCTDSTPPGTQVVLRGGNYPTVGSTGSGNFARWATFFRLTGDAPGSSSGTGPISITSRPTELAVLDQSTGYTGTQAAGGFFGPDGTRALETNHFDMSTGWGHYIEVSWLKIIANPVGPRDGAPFNANNGMDYNRISALDTQWLSTVTGAQHAKCGAYCGDGAHVRIFANNFHDMSGDTGADETHGIYPDSGSSEATVDMTIAFNSITNVNAGSHISMNASGCIGTTGGSACAISPGYMKNIFIHNNFMKGSDSQHLAKANVVFSKVRTAYVWNNVLTEADQAAIDVSDGSIMTTNGFQVFHNSIANFSLGSNRYAFWDQGGDASAGADYRNNIVYRSAGAGTPDLNFGWDSIDNSSALGQFTNNTWFDATTPCGASCIQQVIPDSGSNPCPVTAGDCGTGGQKADPLFNALNWSAHTYDLTLQLGSPAIDSSAAETGIVPREWDYMFKPMCGTTWDAGAYEYHC